MARGNCPGGTLTNLVFVCGYFFSRKVIVTSAQWVRAFDEVQQGAHRFHTGVWAKVLRAVFDDFSGSKDARETLFFNANPGVGFVVF